MNIHNKQTHRKRLAGFKINQPIIFILIFSFIFTTNLLLIRQTNADQIIYNDFYSSIDNTKEQNIHEHIKQIISTTNVTCENNGVTVYKCDCGLVRPYITFSTGHQYILQKEISPTYISDGKKEYICTFCGDIKTEILTQLPSIADLDMCGESLLFKPLPHAKLNDIMINIFDFYNKELDDFEKYVVNCDKNLFESVFKLDYAYMFFYVPKSFIIEKDNSICNLYVYNDTEYVERNKEAINYVYEILNVLGIDKTTTQKEAIIKINNFICENKKYSDHNVDRSLANSIFGSTGICHNYAVAFQTLCLASGIECYYIESKEMNHAWNQVVFSDGSHLWVDVTWNDLNDNNQKYLLISDEEFKITHIID